jgi:release factor glutamine methyltransferase
MQSVQNLLRDGIRRLEAKGVPSPRLDAELLLAHVLHLDRLDLYAHPERAPTLEERTRWEEALARREEREPLPYIRGEVEFYGRPFRVGPAALIPRPETEVLVEAVAARVPPNATILDVGTGSGCIALALALTLPEAQVIGLDPSPDALALARENASALGLTDRLLWMQASWQEFMADSSNLGMGSVRLPLDAIAVNPPYIPTAEVDRLEPELCLYEPRLALDGGPDGLCLIRPLVQEGWQVLRPGGILAMEMAMGQDTTVLSLVSTVPEWTDIAVLPDLAGIPRVLIARRAA